MRNHVLICIDVHTLKTACRSITWYLCTIVMHFFRLRPSLLYLTLVWRIAPTELSLSRLEYIPQVSLETTQ